MLRIVVVTALSIVAVVALASVSNAQCARPTFATNCAQPMIQSNCQAPQAVYYGQQNCIAPQRSFGWRLRARRAQPFWLRGPVRRLVSRPFR